ncbi:PREDICTED: uncharacterized protein LOC104588726 [Nelumbo nucifera]|uniref:Uncharacterized protein LOC104588726 n=2 Tax=Nelumbo nucifera TaxID=4432 RepID=A0A1U7ZCN4_NELNU|nr:PREDICTED: uncharacterized protein LOC104588726 [Nelumbo nucifera]DAD39402.1 TPA_asm: hypothetical protein HUJ06_013725 [Nelumbo nucifera]
MGNQYNHQQNHHWFRLRSIIPMLCLRPPVTRKERLPKCDGNAADEYSSYKEPVSPRVGCMGQVKRSNKVVGFPTHQRCTHSKDNGKKKYFKLQKMFSSKDLVSTSSSRRQMLVGRSRDRFDYEQEDYSSISISISIVDLDPPLPVVKRAPNDGKDGGEVVSLWKRRCGGEVLKGLDVKQRQTPFAQRPASL